MVKGSVFWSRARGKLGNMVMTTIRGEEIVRAYQPNVLNPKTTRQIYQRIRFAQMVKFYRHAVANFFRFAFEDKKKNESDYNAFARWNVNRGLLQTREQYLNNMQPAWGYRYLMSKGSLGAVALTPCANNFFSLPFGEISSSPSTVKLASEMILKKADFAEGDIVTGLVITSEQKTAGENQFVSPPVWNIAQFKVDTTDTRALSDVAPLFGGGQDANTGTLSIFPPSTFVAENACVWACVIISRNTADSKLLVTDSLLYGNSVAEGIATEYKESAWETKCMLDWGAKTEPILKGGLVSEKEETDTTV